MAATLRKSLKTIEDYKSTNPHYTDLLEILGEILILREQYRNNMESSIFTVNENIISQKMEGGLPLIIDEDWEYTKCEIEIPPNCRILLYTDGLDEAFPEDGRHREHGVALSLRITTETLRTRSFTEN